MFSVHVFVARKPNYIHCILGPFTTLRKPMKILLPGGVQEQWPVKAMATALIGKQKVNTLVQDSFRSQ